MKELSIEEKAKRYDEAIEKAKKIKDNPFAGYDGSDVISYLFPELKESEEEKIRKDIIKAFKVFKEKQAWVGHCLDDIDWDKCIAWLEKQGEQKPYASETMNEKGDFDSGFTRMMENKQKPADNVKPKFKHGDRVKNKKSGLEQTLGNCIEDVYEGAFPFHIKDQDKWELVELNLIDKPELKFKVGDLVTNSIETVQITGYDIDYGYQVDYKGNLQHRDTDIIEKEYHHWTIQDAKDGNVLATKDAVFIFKHTDKTGLSLCKSYCEVIGNSELGLGFDFSINNVYPATKEQRDLLFAKMEEAGYEWDAEKKELKKISQEYPLTPDECIKIAWSEEDEHLFHAIINSLDREKLERTWKTTDDVIGVWLNSFKNRLYLQHNQGWSEGDDNHFRMCLNIMCGSEGEYAQYLKQEAIDWFKSLKDRVQPKQEWSVEDDILLNDTIYTISEGKRFEKELKHENCHDPHTYQVIISWLKSLKERHTWKPSEKQIEALEHFIRSIGESGFASPYDSNTKLVYSLLSELKKLRLE